MSGDPKITRDLVHALVADQFPQWAGVVVKPLAESGWDNRIFHLGPVMIVRMLHTARYAMQPAKEWRWLPHIGAHTSLAAPGSGRHNFYRGGDLRIYDQDMCRSGAQLGSAIDAAVILRV